MYGFDSPEELMSSRINIAVDAYADPHERENFLRLMTEQGFVKGYEYEVKRKDGRKIWFYEDAKAVKDEQGNILFFEGFVVDITERKETENTLKNKAALLTNLIINLQEGILLENAKRQIALTNQLFCDMFAIPAPPALLTGADCSESAEQSKGLFKNPEKFVADIDFILANKKAVYSDELELTDGRFFERDYIPTYIDNEYSGHLWKYRDITERKQSQLKIEKSEERFRQVVGQSREVVWEVDANGLYTYVSPLSMQVYGYSPEQLIGKLHFYDIAPEGKREEFKNAALNTFSQKLSFENLINSVCRPDGTITIVETNGIPMLNEAGALIGYRGIDADITDRVEAERKMLESMEKFRSITEQTTDLIAIVDENGFITFASPSSSSIFLISPSDMCGHNFSDFVDKNEIERAGMVFLTCMENDRNIKEVEFRMNRFDGSTFIGELNGSRFKTETQNGVLVTIRDITERKQAEFIRNARIRLTEFAHAHSRNELQQKLLDELEQLTDSNIGFLHSVSVDQKTLTLQSCSTRTLPQMHKSEIGNVTIDITNAGVWVDCFIHRKAVIHNDYSSLPHRKGLPEGHAMVIRELLVPIIRNELIVAVVGMGNKLTNYSEKDLEIVSKLSDLAWDITERKGVEESLKKLSQAVEQSPEVIYITNSEGLIEYVNPKARELTGYSDEELIGKNPRIFSSGEKPAEEYKNLWQTISAGNDWKGDFHNKKKNGEFYWVAASISPVTDTNGKITHYLAVEEDITERKKAEEKSRLQNERLNAIVSAMPDLIFVIDKDGIYSEFYQSNTNARLIPIDKVIGTNLKEFFNAIQADNYLKNIRSCIHDNKLVAFEYQLSEENSINYYEARLTPYGNDKVLSFVRDVTDRVYSEMEIQDLNTNLEIKIVERTSQLAETNVNLLTEIEERKQVEIEIKQAKIEAEQANLAKSEFLSRMSHELRTPMNSILGFAQLLDMGELIPAHRKGVNHILNSGKHLLDLINEVLDISKIEAGRISLSMEPLKLNSVILEMLDVVHPQASKRNLAIEFLDSPSNKLSVIADNQRFKQVLLNLINNAVKYNREGGSIKIKTELLCRDLNQKARIRISVIDTGIGINADEINKLFLPFERIGAERTETEGTGLGLTVAKKLMLAMGGSIGVESIPGEGSTFWIELLQSKNKLNNMKELVSAMDSESSEAAILGTILYIEDNASNIELVEQILAARRSNVRLISNKTGKQALSLALEFSPDLILLDLDLPDIHGSKVLKHLQDNDETKSIPVVIISADAMHHQVEKLIEAGARKYLTKPLHVLDYLKVIDEFIGK
jgi:PAS domain S-box-containing protein